MFRTNRRLFLSSTAAVATGFMGLRNNVHAASDAEAKPDDDFGYGPLMSDPEGRMDLPEGFSYQIISTAGEVMDDGLAVPGLPDGMATFPGPFGLTMIIRNHELTPNNTGPFGEKRDLIDKVPGDKLYDRGRGKTPSSGGTSTILYDTRRQQVVREFMSLAGTIRNCAGGPTPWKSWITCEETVDRQGTHGEDDDVYETEQDHGYNFEVPAATRVGLAEPVPLLDMGRFNHEAIAVDARSGVVYQTEDRDDGLIYRFLPKVPGKLREGGRLQALVIAGHKSLDTRNWDRRELHVGDNLQVEWIDMEEVASPEDDLRTRGFDAGAARFARGEGMWTGSDGIYFACTSGGSAKKGQIWRYVPSTDEGHEGEHREPGKLQLFIEPNDGALIENADNLTVSPWGDLIVCEDRSGLVVRLIGVTPEGRCYRFAHSHLRGEFAGATFSPDGTALLVNAQPAGLTFAITGPWRTASRSSS